MENCKHKQRPHQNIVNRENKTLQISTGSAVSALYFYSISLELKYYKYYDGTH